MSIWVNHEHVGTDLLVPETGLHQRGVVLSYAEGFSNHYPEIDGDYERLSAVLIPHIPIWCVPGHDDATEEATGPWLRLDVNSERHVAGKPTGEPASASVALDIDAARTLAADLLAWADGPHVFPTARQP